MDFKKLILTVAVSAVAGILAAVATVFFMDDGEKTVYVDSEGSPVRYEKVDFSENHFPDFTYSAEKCVNAVVHVKVVVKEEQPMTILDFFFGVPSHVREREIVGAGSGVIISPDGYIVTNNHVINGARNIEVTLSNNRKQRAVLVGSDPRTDIALLKIEAENLPYMEFGDSDRLRLGEWVLAIGNPYNLKSTITAGIVSAKARSISDYMSGDLKIESFIQTDAAVNPGNSGGALVNTKGELVGINTAIASSTGSYVGYSFAVPANMVERVVEDLKEFGNVRRAVLGVSMVTMTDELSSEFNASTAEGVGVYRLLKNGAADRAGIKVKDVIVGMNGNKIGNAAQVQELMTRFHPGDTVSVQVVRKSEHLAFEVVLQGDEVSGTEIGKEKMEFFGALLSEPSMKDLQTRGIRFGVKVVEVGNGKFRDAGIGEDFIITHVNEQEIYTLEDFSRAVGSASRSIMIEGVSRNGRIRLYGIGL